MEDILEELVGDIWDEHDEVEEDFRRLEDGTLEAVGSARLEELFELLDIREDYDAVTVSGWVMQELGSIPRVGDTFDFQGRRITVTAVDGRCAARVAVDGPSPA